jgi:hypothetical protein
MPLYTFFCRREDGTAVTFETAELSNDEAAIMRLEGVLHGHASCDYVEAFEDERLVAASYRAG